MLPDLDFDVDFDPDLSDHPIIVVIVTTSAGRIEIMAEVSSHERALTLKRTHVQSVIGSNQIGLKSLRAIARMAMERMGYDEIIVEGAARTTGANPGRSSKPLRFAVRSRPPAS